MGRKILAIVLGVILGAIVGAIGGLVLGAIVGGNLMQDFEFNGVRGYEAVGLIGAMIGIVVGVALGVVVALKIVGSKDKRIAM